MKKQRYEAYTNLEDQPFIGQKRRFNNMKRRLAIGFKQTSLATDDKGQYLYASNRNTKGKYVPVMITLTYPSNEHWKPKDIIKFTQNITKYAQRNWNMKLRYLWVAETTKNGVIHYHLLTWIPRNKRLPKPSQPIETRGKINQPWWKYRAKVEGVRKGVYGYLLKYISKGCIINGLGIDKPLLDSDGKQVYKTDKNGRKKPVIIKPRLFGYGGFDKNTREFMTYSMLPRYVRKHFNSVKYGDSVQRIKGGWQLKKSEIITKIWKYFHYGNEKLKTNYELWSNELNGKKIIGYTYGVNWSTIPEPSNEDIWYPF